MVQFARELLVKEKTGFPRLSMCAYNYGEQWDRFKRANVELGLISEVGEAHPLLMRLISGLWMWERRGTWVNTWVSVDVVSWMW